MVRRLALLTLVTASVGVSACNPRSDISAEEVLRRSIIRSHTVDSASFAASLTAQSEGQRSMSGSSVLQGVIQNGGVSWSLVSTFRLWGIAPNDVSSGTLSFLTPDSHVYYVRMNSMQGQVTTLLPFAGTGSRSGWWTVGEAASTPPLRSQRVPTPAELDAAVSLFSIRDFPPPTRGTNGRLEYQIDVSLTREALQTLFGEYVADDTVVDGSLTIDASDFTLRRSQWILENLQRSTSRIHATLDVTLQDFDEAAEVLVPSGSSATLPLKDFFATFSL